METLLLGATLFQTASTIDSSRTQATAARQQSKFRSQQLQTNSRLAELRAKETETAGKKAAKEERERTKKLIGKQRARFAGQGVEVDSGSPLDVQLETAELGALDAMTLENNAFRTATGHRIEAIDTARQAAFEDISGRTRSRNTLLSGGLTAAYQFITGIDRIRR